MEISIEGKMFKVEASKDEKGRYLVRIPVLGIYGYSETDEKEALSDFLKAVDFFVEYHKKRGNLETMLNHPFFNENPNAKGDTVH
jgi:hypothetical protein